jgi:hypothetical protein
MDRRPLKATVTEEKVPWSVGDLNPGRGQGERPRDPWRMMSELLAADRVATKSIERPPVQMGANDRPVKGRGP